MQAGQKLVIQETSLW